MRLDLITLAEITDSEGAVLQLSARFGRTVSHDSLRQYVQKDQLRSFVFVRGVFSLRDPNTNTRGKDLFFLRKDLDAMLDPLWLWQTSRSQKQAQMTFYEF